MYRPLNARVILVNISFNIKSINVSYIRLVNDSPLGILNCMNQPRSVPYITYANTSRGI